MNIPQLPKRKPHRWAFHDENADLLTQFQTKLFCIVISYLLGTIIISCHQKMNLKFHMILQEPRLFKNDEVSMHITPRLLGVPSPLSSSIQQSRDIPIHAENVLIIITNPASFELLKPKSASGEERISNANALPDPVAAIPVESWPNKNGQKLQINAQNTRYVVSCEL